MSKLVTLTANGHVPLPDDVRVSLGVAPGGEVELDVLTGGEIRVRRPRHVTVKVQGLNISLTAGLAKLTQLRTGRDPEEIMRDIRGDDPFPP